MASCFRTNVPHYSLLGGFESLSVPQAGRISSRSTKVLIAIRVLLVTHRIVCDTRNGQPRKKSSASSHRFESTGKRCKVEGLVRLDKFGFNTFVERLGQIWALGGEVLTGVKVNISNQAVAMPVVGCPALLYEAFIEGFSGFPRVSLCDEVQSRQV